MMMIQSGEFINGWCIMRPSGFEAFDCTNGKKVIRVSTTNILKDKFEGELMYNITPKPVKEKVKTKPKKKIIKPRKSIKKK